MLRMEVENNLERLELTYLHLKPKKTARRSLALQYSFLPLANLFPFHCPGAFRSQAMVTVRGYGLSSF